MKLRFLEKQHEIGNIFSFFFMPDKPFTWIAGQSLRFEIELSYTSDERRFTIASAPFEKHIRITTRVSDSKFKQALHALRPGDEINAYGLEGDFIWKSDAQNPLLFIANGVGITPFFSMLRAREHAKQPLKAQLFYAGRNDQMPFVNYLNALAQKHNDFQMQLLIDQRNSVEAIMQTVPDIAQHQIFISGPTPMVQTLNKDFKALATQVYYDNFTGRW